MGRVVDDRVVQMQFENANFERNVAQSMSTLDKLKAALSFKGVENNFGEVERSTLSLTKSFDAFETIATGMFLRLGQQATDWAERTVKAMSGVDNVKAGFEKFGSITRATGTLISQGFDIEDVEEQLDRLNWFTDETSYNLSDMVDNISKFTAAGQSLPDSADAMMGIALWAALSGQNAQTASRAMYQLSQAMGTFMKRQDWMSIQNANMDTVEFRQKALDAAVAAGTLQKSADGMYRTLIDGAKSSDWFTRDQFVDSLTEGAWFTKDVMMKVFREYSAGVDQIYAYTEEHGVTASEAIEALGDQIDSFALKAFKAGQEARTWGDVMDSIKDAASTGWMALFKKIFGNYEQATKFYTELANRFYDIFVEPINQLNDAFLKWAKKGGRSIFIDSLLTLLGVVENVFFGIQDAYNQFFYGTDEMDKITDQQGMSLLKATYGFKDFAYSLFHATENLDNFTSVLNGVFGIFDLIKQAAGAAIDTIFSLFGGLDPITDIIGSIAGNIGDFIGDLSKSSKESNFFGKAFNTAFKPLFNIKDTILEFVEKLTPKFSKAWGELAPQFEKLKPGIDKVKESLSGFFGLFQGYWERLFTHIDVDGVIAKLGKLWDKLRDVLFRQDENGLDIFDKLNNWLVDFSGSIDSATVWIREHVSKLWGIVKEETNKFVDWMVDNAGPAWENIKEKATEVFEWVKAKLGPYWNMIKSGFSTAYDWIINNTDKLEGYFTKVWEFIKSVGSTIWSFLSGLYGGKAAEEGDLGLSKVESKMQKFLDAVKKIAGVIGTVFSGLWKLISPILDGISNSFQNMSFEGLGTAAAGGGLAVIGVALARFINNLKKSNILQGLNEILGGIGNVLDSFAHTLDAKALKEAAIGVGILVGALFVLTTIPIDDLTTTATVLGIFVNVFIKSVQSISDATSHMTVGKGGLDFTSTNAGSTFFKMALGLVAMALALKIIASIPTDALYQAAIVVGVLTAVIGKIIGNLATIKAGDKTVEKNVNKAFGNGNASGNFNNILNFEAFKVPGIILAIGLSLFIVTKAVGQMASQIEKNGNAFAFAVFTILGLMVSIFAVLKNLDKVELDGSLIFAWIGIAGAIWILAKVIEPLGGMSVGSLVKGVGAIVVLMAAMGGLSVMVDKWGSSGGKLAAFSASMLLLVGVIYALVGAVALMAVVMQNEKAGDAFVVLGLLIAAIALLVSQATKFNKGSDMIKFAEGLIVLSVALGLIAGVLYVLAEVAAGGHLVAAGIALGVILGAIVGLAAVIGKFNAVERGFKVLIALGTTIAVIMASAAASIYLIAQAIKVFSDNSINFDRAAENMMAVVNRAMDSLPRIITKLIEVAVGVLISKVTLLSTTALDTVLAVLESLLKDDKLQRIISGILEAVNIILDNLIENAEPIVSKLVQLAGIVIITACRELGIWVEQNRDAISTALDQLITGLINIILALFDPLGKKIFGNAWDGENGIKTKVEGTVKTAAEAFVGIWLVGWVGRVCTALAPIGSTLTGFISHASTLLTSLGKIVGLASSIPHLLTGLGAAAGAVLSFGMLDEAAASKRPVYDKRHEGLTDYYSSAAGLAEIRADTGYEAISPDLMYKYATDAYERGLAYNPNTGTIVPYNSALEGTTVSEAFQNALNSFSASVYAAANSGQRPQSQAPVVTMNQYNNFQGNSTPTDTYLAGNSMVGKISRVLNAGYN